MKLLDFKMDADLNNLRDKMGAEHLGNFELFDPERHLSWQERQQLAKQWVEVKGNGLHGLDNILYFKNSAVVAQVDNTFHFALCDDLKKRITHGQLTYADITTFPRLLSQGSNCPYCLHAVSYEGFDVYRHRHQQYNDKILKAFNLTQYVQSKFQYYKQ